MGVENEQATLAQLVSRLEEKSFNTSITEAKMNPFDRRQTENDIEVLTADKLRTDLLDIVLATEVQSAVQMLLKLAMSHVKTLRLVESRLLSISEELELPLDCELERLG